jgi:outer membrane protein OmpA-like peptidoglycan-associated protein
MLLAFYLYSQNTFLDIQNYKLSNSVDNLLLEDSLNPQSSLSKSTFILGVGFNRAVNNILIVKDSAGVIDEKYSVDAIQGLDVHLGLIIKKRILIGLSVDYKEISLRESSPEISSSSWSFGDPRLIAKIRLTPNDKKYAMALSLYGSYPVNKNSFYASDVGWSAGAIVSFDYYFSRGFIALNLGGAYLSETGMPIFTSNGLIGAFTLKGKMLGGIGGGFFINDYISIQNEYYGTLFLPKNGEDFYKAVDALLYIKFSFNSFYLYAGGALRGLSFFEKDTTGSRGLLESRIFLALRYSFLQKMEEKEAPKEELLENLTIETSTPPDLLSSGLEMEKFSEELPLSPTTAVTIKDEIIENRNSLKLTTVYFDFAKSVLNFEAKSILNDVVQKIKTTYSNKVIKIYGHTDGRGPRKLHKKYSLERAKRVKEYLQSKGVSNSLEIFSYDIPQRISTENISEESSFKKNRRVEIFAE